MSQNGRTHAARALITLRQRIVNGTLSGGTRLFEVVLAEELDISRTPIRAALAQLAEEGLLDRAKGGGFVVRSFKLADVLDTIELRGVLEGMAARFAAERGATPAQLAEAQTIIHEIDAVLAAQPIEMSVYSACNARFHDLLVNMSGSDALARQIDRVTALPFASPSAFLENDTHVDQLFVKLTIAQEQHRAIVEAIANREGARAESIAREHARAARRNVEFLTSREDALQEGVPTLAILTP